MMPRWAIFLPLLGVVAAGAVLFMLLGGRSVTTTETQAIARVADLYVAETGAGQRTDCAARPAVTEGLWLVVSCVPSAGRGVDYFVDRFGRIVDQSAPGGEG